MPCNKPEITKNGESFVSLLNSFPIKKPATQSLARTERTCNHTITFHLDFVHPLQDIQGCHKSLTKFPELSAWWLPDLKNSRFVGFPDGTDGFSDIRKCGIAGYSPLSVPSIVLCLLLSCFTFHLGFVHPLQDVALHQCLPLSSVYCFPVSPFT